MSDNKLDANRLSAYTSQLFNEIKHIRNGVEHLKSVWAVNGLMGRQFTDIRNFFGDLFAVNMTAACFCSLCQLQLKGFDFLVLTFFLNSSKEKAPSSVLTPNRPKFNLANDIGSAFEVIWGKPAFTCVHPRTASHF